MARLVLDTNVVLDLLHWHDAAAAPLLAALEDGRACCLADTRTLAELRRVLAYPELRLSPEVSGALFTRYTGLAESITECPVAGLPRCRDRDDQMFLELAARGNADLLVTRDKALLGLRGRTRLAFRIAKPADALKTLAG
ncbi:MAG: putative toxin-antitoxin system toxin component, PIN family [Betaproteobacteria bacterium]|nr:putative toxin-antitoxin system toxin component, PIN family [Betaproteobacteria bacterium]